MEESDRQELEKLEKLKLEKLKPRLTDEFLETLIEAAKIYGWDGDHIETMYFIRDVNGWAGKDMLSDDDLKPYYDPE